MLHRLDTNTQGGLTSAEVQQRLEKHGRNELTEKKRNPILHYLSFMWNPLSWAMVRTFTKSSCAECPL